MIWRAANSLTIQPINNVTNPDWHIVGTGDYNGDGRADVLWRNVSTGANTIWRSADSYSLQPVAAITDLTWVVAP
jgi:hypothetical protein